MTSAKRQRLGLVAGLNLLNGGCGPATGGSCLSDIPGTTLPGTRAALYQMSAAEFIHYKTSNLRFLHRPGKIVSRRLSCVTVALGHRP